jgi:4-diphosphocytidyl-2-C-methyl-D-erythritol kinase
MPFLENDSFWIAKPQSALATKRVYDQMTAREMVHDMNCERTLENFYQGRAHYFNDLEESAFALVPSLKSLKIALQDAGFDHVCMTGSGTAFFCLGAKFPPTLSGVRFFKVRAIHRKEGDWYAGK